MSRDTQSVQFIVYVMDVEESWFDSIADQEIFLFCVLSRVALWPTQTLFQGVKLAGHKADR